MAISAYFKAACIGAVAGLRTMTAPAVTLAAQDSPWSGAGRLLAFGEYIGDKLPFTPSRLSPPALIARAVSGGWCGGAVAARLGGSRLAGVGYGVAGSLAGAWAGYSLRNFLAKTKGLPDTGIALAEDAIAVWGARFATRVPG
jgi:uncharacterized membrane protein